MLTRSGLSLFFYDSMSSRACFRFNPSTRPTAEDLLRHQFSADFHHEEEEPIYPHGAIGTLRCN